MDLSTLSNHVIICGTTSVALMAAERVHQTGLPFVLVGTEAPDADGFPSLTGNWHGKDPADDSVLLAVGLRTSQGLICALDDDRESLFVTATARYLNPQIRIVATAHNPSMGEKLYLAGADSVVYSTRIIGLRMASEMIRPSSVQLLDKMLREQDAEPRIELVEVPPGSQVAGAALRETEVLSALNLDLVGISRRGQNELIYNPPATTVIEGGDVLVVLGTDRAAERARAQLAEPQRGSEDEKLERQ